MQRADERWKDWRDRNDGNDKGEEKIREDKIEKKNINKVILEKDEHNLLLYKQQTSKLKVFFIPLPFCRTSSKI